MSLSSLLFSFLILLGSFAIIFMVMNAINGLRDCMKMSLFARVAKESTYRHGMLQMYRFGMASMIFEGDTMRASSAILGFTNGRVISQPESVVAMLVASSWKALWVWVSGVFLLLSMMFEQSWVLFSSIGFIVILLNLSYLTNLIGRFFFYIAMLLLSLQLSCSTISSIVTKFDIQILQQYTIEPDIVGILFSAFIGIFVGAGISGNLLSVFMALIFALEGVVCPECAASFAIAAEIGTLFPMSFMVSDTNHNTRSSFLCFAIVEFAVLIFALVFLSVVPMPWITELGAFGFIIYYSVFFSLMLPFVYYLIGARLWSKVNSATRSQLFSSKRHLHQFDKIYRPHVSIMLIQAEKEIVNLQYRIHKMLNFIIDIIDEDNVESSLEHVRKYKNIVYRTANEITDFIIAQTSEKTNDHVSALAKERLQAVSCQCQVGSLFCDLAEAVYRSEKENKQIVRRCVVAVETLFNQATKLIDMRYSVSDNEVKVFDDNVEMLSLQLANLLGEYGHDASVDVFSYTIDKSGKEIVEIINNLK